MSSAPHHENGFTRIPNKLFEAILNEPKGIQSRKLQLNIHCNEQSISIGPKSITIDKSETTERLSLESTNSVVSSHGQKGIKEIKKKTLKKTNIGFHHTSEELTAVRGFKEALYSWIIHRKDIMKLLI